MAETAGAADSRSTVIVSNSLAAQQWEMHFAAEAIGANAAAWETPPVRPYAAWLDELWLERADERGPALTPNQSLALWRRVIGESAESRELIGHAGAAEWAGAAWQLLNRWRIDPAKERAAPGEVDYRAFLGWCRRYREWLADHRWLDRAELEAALTARAARLGKLIVADPPEPYPARMALLEALRAAGTPIAELEPRAVQGTRAAARLADGAAELRAALGWASLRLRATPLARIAIVVPGAAQRRDEIERAAATELPEGARVHSQAGRALSADPTIGAACDALALASAHAPYATFGRWLRSPFFGVPAVERFARARLDTELRAELRSQLPFQAAYRCGIEELLAERAPESARALKRALAHVAGTRRATPSRWVHLWSRMLIDLGWQPPTARVSLLAWQATLDELARLTPILGEISLDGAMAELARLLERAASAALPLEGVHVLTSIADVGPGYECVWLTGFTDAAWPEPPQGNPLLPLRLQRAHRLPYSSPRDATERSERALARLVRRTRELVASWPARVFDYETEPSPALRDWPELAAEDVTAFTAPRALPRAARETVADVAPPFAGGRLPGGTGALGRQARCPLRAYFQDRLGARPLEPLAFGVPARLRGIAAHQAAERLLEHLPTQATLAAQAGVEASVARALSRLFGRARRHLARLYDLEAGLLQRVLTALVAADLERAPFRVHAVEQRMAVSVGALTLNVRVDRLDELANGTVAIIDYKTGERATSADWFGPRLKDAQVPLYASHATEAVSAAVVARLSPTETRYSGIWPEGAFAGRSSKAAALGLAAQIEVWRAQLETLADEFAAGDARIFVDDYDEAAGPYAPLTRVFEQLALARGAAAIW